MAKSPFIWLGSGRARKRGVARKGALLDDVTKAGLPVPAGGILLDDFYRICLEHGVIVAEGSSVQVPDTVWLLQVLYNDARFPRLRSKVAVRAAGSYPGAQQGPRAGARLDVDPQDPEQLAAALAAVWSGLLAAPAKPPLAVLVMQMVPVQQGGCAFLGQLGGADRVHLAEGSGDVWLLPQLRAFRRPAPDLAPFARRLQLLLRGLRRTLGHGEWTVEWADDGQTCWVLQIG